MLVLQIYTFVCVLQFVILLHNNTVYFDWH